MIKPRVFIGSSAESLDIAAAIRDNLEYSAEVTLWPSGTFNFNAGSNTLADLIRKSRSVDFAIFIFSPDDLLTMRSQEKHVVRDNVVFELGLFIGVLGSERCFIVKPRGVELHLPSDLLGVNAADFEPDRSDKDIVSSLGYASSQIKREIDGAGPIVNRGSEVIKRIDVSDVLQEVSDQDLLVLATLLDSYNHDVEGCVSWQIQNKLSSKISDMQINLSIIKLWRLSLISKENSSDDQGNEYFTYALTSNGVDVCLKNEERISEVSKIQNPAYSKAPSYQQPPKF